MLPIELDTKYVSELFRAKISNLPLGEIEK